MWSHNRSAFASFLVSEASVGTIWVRVEAKNQSSNARVDSGNIIFVTSVLSDNPSSLMSSRKHLSPQVRSRMKELRNNICPRGEDGAMLSNRCRGPNKRPSWCIHAIMTILRNEFDKSELDGAQEKAMSCMARNTLTFTRLN